MVEQNQKYLGDLTGSCLTQIDLTPQEMLALRRQGSVCVEARSRNCTVYKLRFRMAGRQQVRYLGTDPLFAAAVREELRLLRRAQVAERELRTLAGEARKRLRQSKARLLPIVEQSGYAFHGLSIRRPRDK